MYKYNSVELSKLLGHILQNYLLPGGWTWLQERASLLTGEKWSQAFYTTFMTTPRFTGKRVLEVTSTEKQELNEFRKGFSISSFTTDRAARIWLLLQLPTADKSLYINSISQLFLSAEMNELVALYSALPVLAYPEEWEARCAEGIRTNMAPVMEAILYENPYPREYLNQAEWNQMILKAFFTDKQVHRIEGLDERANHTLAEMLSDYAHERWAAGRTVNPQLWRLIGKFIDEIIFPDIQKLAGSSDGAEREAAALACSQSGYGPAQELLNSLPYLKSSINNNRLTWEVFAGSVQKTTD